MLLKGYKKASVAAKPCPKVFRLISDTPSYVNLPYRMVIAVATQDSVVLYDTQHQGAIAEISNIHYATITDIAW